ncbi:MAG: shikimate dehydrogenase [Alphaproteobacteria bacterium]|nr:shikimate dehydrogenase [Alphaproteobacteria bacterium]MDE2629663.1 shikimate dehydrogenase [Alphaproteobacteria bacterium]
MSITGRAKLAGVVGWPIAHSLSPKLHGYWLDEYGIDAAYVPLAVRREDFAAVINGLRLAGFKGVNVTIPHKEAAFALAASCDAVAEIAGAANLLLFGENGIEARNTDVASFTASVVENIGADGLRGRPAVLWGAGGMARAAVCALSDLGVSEIRILNRTKARAETLAAALAPRTAARLVCAGFEDWSRAGSDAAVLVNASSAGMTGVPALDLPLEVLPAQATVFDAVYNPLETALLARAKAGGLCTVDGLGMLMHQAVPAFAAFFGEAPKITPSLRRVMEEALRGGG